MTETNGNGWNTNRIAIDQEGEAAQIFGEEFFTGSQYTETISVIHGKPVSVSISVKGKKVKKIGMKITDLQGNIICERKPGYKTPQGFAICEFCPGCGEVSTTTLKYDLRSGLADPSGNFLGYNGTKLGITFNGKMIEVGEDFNSGSVTDKVEFQWDIGSSIQVVSLAVPDDIDTRFVGYRFYDSFDNIQKARWPSEKRGTFKQGKVLTTFLPNLVE